MIRSHLMPWTYYTYLWLELILAVVKKSIQLFAFGQTIFSALELYVACTAAASGRPSRLHVFGLCQHDLTQVHVVTRSMHRSHR